MKIDSSYVSMESVRKYRKISMNRESFFQEQMGVDSDPKARETFKHFLKSDMDEEATSQMEDSMLGLRQGKRDVSSVKKSAYEDEEKSIRAIKARCIFYLIRSLFSMNKDNNLSMLSDMGGSQSVNTYNEVTAFRSETEETEFNTQGTVMTADGRKIDFGLQLKMSREFTEYYEKTVTRPDYLQLVDPLVINLDGNIPNLSDQTFLFDLDADGSKENIHSLSSGSGYLALDANGDGVINDGSELFGTKSGDGFEDLSMYDDDGNGWIDENDEIFSRLKIWTKDADGNDVLYRLADKGVGAISLQRVNTEFSLNQAMDNQTRGVIRNTGVFLYENGGVGTMMHLDVAT